MSSYDIGFDVLGDIELLSITEDEQQFIATLKASVVEDEGEFGGEGDDDFEEPPPPDWQQSNTDLYESLCHYHKLSAEKVEGKVYFQKTHVATESALLELLSQGLPFTDIQGRIEGPENWYPSRSDLWPI